MLDRRRYHHQLSCCRFPLVPGNTLANAYSTIGAGGIVTRSIPARVRAYGQPARVVRSLDSVADGPPAAFTSAKAMTLSEALQLGADEARRHQVRREVEILKLEDEMPLPRSISAPAGWRSLVERACRAVTEGNQLLFIFAAYGFLSLIWVVIGGT